MLRVLYTLWRLPSHRQLAAHRRSVVWISLGRQRQSEEKLRGEAHRVDLLRLALARKMAASARRCSASESESSSIAGSTLAAGSSSRRLLRVAVKKVPVSDDARERAA